MNICIIGASAGIGLATVKRALTLGHHVTALSRREITLEDNQNLNVIQGSALDERVLKEAIKDSEAILVTLGMGMSAEVTTLFSDFAELLLKINEKEPLQVPVIIVTGFGSGESRRYLKTMVKPLFRLILNKLYEDKAKMEQMIAKSTLQWEVVRPGLLNDKPLSELYRVETELYNGMKIGSISRNDVADYLVKEAVSQQNLGKFPALSNK